MSGLRAQLGPERLFTGQVDVTDRSALEAGLARFCADNTGGGLDMMWNNAGIGASGWFEDVPHEAALRVVAINFTAVLTGAYAALPYLRRTPGSLMFSTSSSSATYGMPQLAVYSATKHAVKGLTEALSVEWQRHGVRVADIAARAPRRGMFRLLPPSSVAETAWAAYHDTGRSRWGRTRAGRLHWYVPDSLKWIDRLKGVSAEFVRGRIVKQLPALIEEDDRMKSPADIEGFEIDSRARQVYGEPHVTADGTTIVPVARVSRRGTGDAARVTARPVGVLVIKDGRATWKPTVDSTRIALFSQLIGLVAAALAGLAMVRRPPWPDLHGDISSRPRPARPARSGRR